MSMLQAEKTLLGFRRTKWHGLPVVAVSNGRARAIIHSYGENFNADNEANIYGYAWPLDGCKFKLPKDFSPWHGLQFQVNPATPPVSGGQTWNTQGKGFLEDSAIHFARFVKSDSYNAFLPDDLEAEMYIYCPNGIEPQFKVFYDFVKMHAPYFEYDFLKGEYSGLGRGPAPAALTIHFLKRLHDLKFNQDDVRSRIKALADYLLSLQYTEDPSKGWYGGLPSLESATTYYSIDAAFVGEAFLDAYEILGDTDYLEAAELCAAFLRHMQTRHEAGLVDQYYGGFCEYVDSSNGAYDVKMYVKLLLALPFLKRLYTLTGNSLYNTMAQDARSFLGTGLEGYYEYYFPSPYGDNQWHRMPPNETVVYGDSIAYALRGVYEYEGLTLTVKSVYNFFQGFTGENYDPKFAWAGYLDVVNQTPYSPYYDTVTGGILAEIRKEHDPDSFVFHFNKVAELKSTAFYWGLNFDYTPLDGAWPHVTTAAGVGWGLSQLGYGPSKDFMVILWHFKNGGSSPISFYFAAYTGNYSHYSGTEKYVHPKFSALVKSDDNTVVWGSSVAPQDCYMDGAWRTADYSDGTPNSNWLRWSLTVDAGEEVIFPFIVIYADSEEDAVLSFNVVKAWVHDEVLEKEIRFWKDWLDKGRRYYTGLWEVDQLAAITLCQIKSFISFDNHALPSSLGVGYSDNHWPADAWTCYYALALWGYLDEAKNYFGTYIKKVTEYITQNSLNLYKNIHILTLTDYTVAGSNYTAEDCFLLPIVAVETWKKDKSDTAFRDNIWSWIQTFMEEIDGDLAESGEWKGFFNHAHIYDAFESWIFVIPHELFGNLIIVVSAVNALLARCYEEAADLAEAVGEYTQASTWRSQAATIRSKFYDFWTSDMKAYYYYWGNVTSYGCNQGWPSWTQTHSPLPEKPVYRLSWIADIKDETMHRVVRLYYDNYLKYFDRLVAAEPSGNWMYGKVDRRTYGSNTGFDMHLWDPFLAAAYLGIDDIVEHFLLGIKEKYGHNEVGFFEEWPTYDVKPSNHWHMIRAMGLFLLGIAFLFNRLDPAPVKKFHFQLRFKGKEVALLKQTGSSTDSFGNIIPSFEPVYVTSAIVEPIRADEQIVQAGYASVDDLRFYFKAFTPVETGDRIRINHVDYAVQTVQNHYFKDRIVKKEVLARKVIE